MNHQAILLLTLIMVSMFDVINTLTQGATTTICYQCKDYLNSAQCTSALSTTGQNCVFSNGMCSNPPASTTASASTTAAATTMTTPTYTACVAKPNTTAGCVGMDGNSTFLYCYLNINNSCMGLDTTIPCATSYTNNVSCSFYQNDCTWTPTAGSSTPQTSGACATTSCSNFVTQSQCYYSWTTNQEIGVIPCKWTVGASANANSTAGSNNTNGMCAPGVVSNIPQAFCSQQGQGNMLVGASQYSFNFFTYNTSAMTCQACTDMMAPVASSSSIQSSMSSGSNILQSIIVALLIVQLSC